MAKLAAQSETGEIGLAQNELAAGTEPAGEEDWAPFYPVDLGNDKTTGS